MVLTCCHSSTVLSPPFPDLGSSPGAFAHTASAPPPHLHQLCITQAPVVSVLTSQLDLSPKDATAAETHPRNISLFQALAQLWPSQPAPPPPDCCVWGTLASPFPLLWEPGPCPNKNCCVTMSLSLWVAIFKPGCWGLDHAVHHRPRLLAAPSVQEVSGSVLSGVCCSGQPTPSFPAHCLPGASFAPPLGQGGQSWALGGALME